MPNLDLVLPETTWITLRAEAGRRGVDAKVLIEDLLNAIVVWDMFNAVLPQDEEG